MGEEPDVQAQIDRRLAQVQLQVDQRFEFTRETLTALKVMLDERYATQTKALDAAFKAAEQAVSVALANAEKATVKAETAYDKRFDAVNEFRQVLTDQTKTFVTRSEYEAVREALAGRVEANAGRVSALELRLTSRLDRGEGADAGASHSRSEQRLNVNMVIAALAALVAVVTLVLYVTGR